MSSLILQNSSGATMTSLELRRVVNEARKLAGESAVENSHFLKRVEDELEGELGIRKVFVNPMGGRPSEYYDLTLDQCLLVGMRESKAVRRKVRDKLKELDGSQQSMPQIPQTYSEALQLAADQAKQLELAAPKVSYYDKVVERDTLLNATQVGQKIGLSAVILNRHLDDLGVYNKAIKRGRAFKQSFVDAGRGIMRQTETGHAQPLFTLLGEAWIIEKLTSEGVI